MARVDASTRGWAWFDTAVGRCGVAWSGLGITAVQLPADDPADDERRLRGYGPGPADPPPAVAAGIERMAALLAGARDDLADVVLDPTGLPEFNLRVYELTRRVPPGEVTTYGDLARTLGAVGSAQAVGQALGRNPYPIVVPCHRVLAADGRMGGFSAGGGTRTKARILAIEGACGVGGQEALF